MPLIDCRRARAEVRLSAVPELLGWHARTRQGEQVRGACPVQGSQSPTRRVFAGHLGRNLWHCFRCGAGGNALDLWVQVLRQPLYPAVLELYHCLGHIVSWREPARRASVNKDKREERSMSE